jgi:hypothetical protein
MKWIAVVAMLGSVGLATQAEAKGCIKGAIVGGIAGHFAGHHGLLGAAAGCAYGRHRANQQRIQQQNNQPPASQTGPGSQSM